MAIKEIYNYGDSVKARLLNISRRNGQSYQMLVTRYLQERLLYRLSISRFYDHFFLKGVDGGWMWNLFACGFL